MWNFKMLKIQRTFQNWSKILELQNSFTTYKCHDVLRKVVVYYTRKHKFFKNQFLVMIWNCYHFKRWNTKL
jgi:hypothetical protein